MTGFIAALSLRMALIDVAPSEGYTLKWPNDVLLNGTKIAGILLETSGSQTRVDWLVVGIGVNLAHAPDITAVEPRATQPSSVAAQLGVRPSAENLLDWLAFHFDTYRKLYIEAGFEPIRRLWLRNAANLGATITARTMRDEMTGTFEDIDNEGNLILKTPEGRTAITAADIFF